MEDIKLAISMVATQVLEVGLNTLIKAATVRGMSDYVFVVYSNAMALPVLLPSSFLYYRKRAFPSITISIIARIFLLSLLVCAGQTLVYTGIGYSSPVLSSVMADLSPVFTFLIAIVFRYENLDVKQVSSLARCMGTVLSIAGALMVTLGRGEAKSGVDSKLEDDDKAKTMGGGRFMSHDEWILGGILLALGSFCLSLVFNVKVG